MELIPLTTLLSRAASPFCSRCCHSSVSPTTGALASPVIWHKAQLRAHFAIASEPAELLILGLVTLRPSPRRLGSAALREELSSQRIKASASILSTSILSDRAFIEGLSGCVEVYTIFPTGFGGNSLAKRAT